jgi:hypothetical protein
MLAAGLSQNRVRTPIEAADRAEAQGQTSKGLLTFVCDLMILKDRRSNPLPPCGFGQSRLALKPNPPPLLPGGRGKSNFSFFTHRFRCAYAIGQRHF